MQIEANDPRFEAAGLSVVAEGKTARIMRGIEELALVAHDAGRLTFFHHRSDAQREALKLIGVLA